jgi:tetrahydromethanopterin S-methyltransferase subunit G
MPGNSGPEVAELREAFEAMQQRMQELEERVDFSERALLKQREADRSESPRR